MTMPPPQPPQNPQHGHNPYPAAPAPQPPYAGAPGYAPVQPGPAKNGTDLGKVGFIIGVAAVALSFVLTFLTTIIATSGSYISSTYFVISSVNLYLTFLLGIAALVLGIIGLRRVPSSTALAGIAIGIGVTVIVSRLTSMLMSAISSLYW
ncbi:hypothetical protein [uncultured Microbacterium sp.]|uniref:hypothetical protein n=1 Tax=uncultured Microbacterium sp. TaxID=191216 RepID=UPI0026338DF7|nr:hypothetical protein [uncultured Microbacterium sp.]